MTAAALPAEVFEELYAPLGLPGSGRRRYAAAMALRQAGQLSDLALEAFRVCSPLDHEDPSGLLTTWRVAHELPPRPVRSAQVLVAGLLREILGSDDFFMAGPDRDIRARLAAMAATPPLPPCDIGSPDAEWPHDRLQKLYAASGAATEVRRVLALAESLPWLPGAPLNGGDSAQRIATIAAPREAPYHLPDAAFGFSIGMREPNGEHSAAGLRPDVERGNQDAPAAVRYRTLACIPGDELGWWFSPSA